VADGRGLRLILDEDLSPVLGAGLWIRGVDTTSVRNRGLLGSPDHTVFRVALDEDRVMVTANVDDFTKLCRGVDIHPGLILVADSDRAGQLAMLEAALAYVLTSSEHDGESRRAWMVNRVVEVHADLSCVTFELPRSGA
jgi:predicted nuclease of predicted toxin-antitoxin system